jgi:hypothetical protein
MEFRKTKTACVGLDTNPHAPAQNPNHIRSPHNLHDNPKSKLTACPNRCLHPESTAYNGCSR